MGVTSRRIRHWHAMLGRIAWLTYPRLNAYMALRIDLSSTRHAPPKDLSGSGSGAPGCAGALARLHLIRFHVVLAPNAKLRSKIIPAPAERTTTVTQLSCA